MRRRPNQVRAAVTAAIVVLLVAACTDQPVTVQTDGADGSPTSLTTEPEFIDLPTDQARALVPPMVDGARTATGRRALRRDDRLDRIAQDALTGPDEAREIWSHEYLETVHDLLGVEAWSVTPMSFLLTDDIYEHESGYDQDLFDHFAASPLHRRWGFALGENADGVRELVLVYAGSELPPGEVSDLQAWMAEGFELARYRSGVEVPDHSVDLDHFAQQLNGTFDDPRELVEDRMRSTGRPLAYGCVESRRAPFAYESATGFYDDDSLGIDFATEYGVAIARTDDRFQYCTVIAFHPPEPRLLEAWHDNYLDNVARQIELFRDDAGIEGAPVPQVDPLLQAQAQVEANRQLLLLVAGVGPESPVTEPGVRATVNGVQRTVTIDEAAVADLITATSYGVGWSMDPTTALSIGVIYWR